MADKRRRYNQRDNDPQKEYKRLVRNTKEKLKRVQENWGVDLSYEIEIPKYNELNTTEKFDDFVEEMTTFTDRGNLHYQFNKNDKGLVYRLSEVERGEELTKQAQENAQNFIDRFKEKKYQVGGREMNYTVGDRMTLYDKENAAGITVPNDFDINAFETRSRLEGRLELLEEKSDGVFFDRSMRTMKENFMKSLKGSFNSEADDIIEMIDVMPEDDFFELFLMTGEFTFEDYASDGSIDGTREQAEMLRGYLHEYYRGNIDMDLKGFYLTDRRSISRNSKIAKRVKNKK
jgi:hypothetical protein